MHANIPFMNDTNDAGVGESIDGEGLRVELLESRVVFAFVLELDLEGIDLEQL